MNLNIIPIGTRVVIKDHPGVFPHCLCGREATVYGYKDNPPTVISLVLLEMDGDVMFKWPALCPWMIEPVEEAR